MDNTKACPRNFCTLVTFITYVEDDMEEAKKTYVEQFNTMVSIASSETSSFVIYPYPQQVKKNGTMEKISQNLNRFTLLKIYQLQNIKAAVPKRSPIITTSRHSAQGYLGYEEILTPK